MTREQKKTVSLIQRVLKRKGIKFLTFSSEAVITFRYGSKNVKDAHFVLSLTDDSDGLRIGSELDDEGLNVTKDNLDFWYAFCDEVNARNNFVRIYVTKTKKDEEKYCLMTQMDSLIEVGTVKKVCAYALRKVMLATDEYLSLARQYQGGEIWQA